MQVMIDTRETSESEIRAAITLLQSLLPPTVMHSNDPAANVHLLFERDSEVPTAPLHPPSLTGAPPPPPPAVTPDDVVGDDDPEVEIDDEGSVTALTASVQLQAPPPPPIARQTYENVSHIHTGIVYSPPAVPAPPGPVVAAELDSRGYPWDGRIHAANRAQTIKREWKLKRGVDKNLVVGCEAQNKPGNVPTTPTTAAPPPLSSGAPSAVTSSAAPATVAATTPVDFRGLMQKIQAATAAGKLSTDQVNAALAAVGLRPEEMAQLIGNALYIASINAAIDSCLT